MENPSKGNYLEKAKEILEFTRNQIVKSVNKSMVFAYFQIGKIIVEEEQLGKSKAAYSERTIQKLSEKLSQEYGRGFSKRNLENMRKFYMVYSKANLVKSEENKETEENLSIAQTVPAQFQTLDFQLSWSHYLFLTRINNENERRFYELECSTNNWSVRELKRQFDSALYERLVLSKDKEGVKELNQKGQIINSPKDAIKEPYVLEFLGLDEKSRYSESDLERAIINKIEHFLLELGKGFAFVARQKRISFDERHFFIDLVFYNRILRCFLLIDLKIGDLRHQDIGQMQMYVNYYDREMRLEGEQKTIGLILCKEKSDLLIQYTLPDDNEQIFASKYQTVLPSKSELKLLLKEQNNE
jgi:predicted nuclease of restriction endonuclease-like (RecB) superfamily